MNFPSWLGKQKKYLSIFNPFQIHLMIYGVVVTGVRFSFCLFLSQWWDKTTINTKEKKERLDEKIMGRECSEHRFLSESSSIHSLSIENSSISDSSSSFPWIFSELVGLAALSTDHWNSDSSGGRRSTRFPPPFLSVVSVKSVSVCLWAPPFLLLPFSSSLLFLIL